jgi:hypothetical protein
MTIPRQRLGKNIPEATLLTIRQGIRCWVSDQ